MLERHRMGLAGLAWQAGNTLGQEAPAQRLAEISGEAGTSGPSVYCAAGCASMSLPSGRLHSRGLPSSLHPTHPRKPACNTEGPLHTGLVNCLEFFRKEHKPMGPQNLTRMSLEMSSTYRDQV